MDWLWRIFQASIVAAVMCANIYWGWTPNAMLAGLIGVGAAFLLTILPLKIWLWFLERRDRRAVVPPRSSRTIRSDKPPDHRLNLL